MPLISKDFAQLDADSVARLVALGYTDASYEGTAVRNIVEAVDIHLGDLYSDLAINLDNFALSRASGAALDALVLLLGVFRRSGESDANLRFRATTARTVEKVANLEAHLSALFALANIRDVVARPFTHGIGSVTFYLIGQRGIVDSTTQALASTTLSSITAAGGYTRVTTPSPVLLNLYGQLALASGASQSAMRLAAQSAAANYLANLSMGDSFIKSKLDQVVIDAGQGQIVDFNLNTVSTTDTAGMITNRLLANYAPAFDEELEPGAIIFT